MFFGLFFTQSRKRVTVNLLLKLGIEGVGERDQRKIAEHFAKYFSSVANDIGDTRLLGHVRGTTVPSRKRA